jgi:hypothetical protein
MVDMGWDGSLHGIGVLMDGHGNGVWDEIIMLIR